MIGLTTKKISDEKQRKLSIENYLLLTTLCDIMDIGKTITHLRKSKEITQDDLAKRCDITQAYLSQIEKNKKEPNLATIKDIALALGVPLPVLFFMALENSDVPENKQEMFNVMKPSMSGFFETIFEHDTKGHN